MRHIIRIMLVAFMLTVPLAAKAEIKEAGSGISVENAYAYATTPVQKNGVVFMTIINSGAAPDRVTAGVAPVAQSVELHTHLTEGSTMKMMKVDAYDIPGGGTVALESGGHHIMLMGLRASLKAGETFPLSLTFEKAGVQEVTVTVLPPGEAPPMADHAHMQH